MQSDYTQSPDARASWFTRPLTLRRAIFILLSGAALALLCVPFDFLVLRTLGPFGGLGSHIKHDVRRELEFAQQFGAITSIALIAATIFLLDPGRGRWIMRLVLTMIAQALVLNVLKVLFSRPRPRVLLGGNALPGHDSPWTFPFAWNSYPLPRVAADGTVTHVHARAFELSQGLSADLWSMPSSHAASAACLAVCLAWAYPRITPLVVTLAVVVGCARVLLGAHYPSDVIVGWTIGYVVGLACCGYQHTSARTEHGTANGA